MKSSLEKAEEDIQALDKELTQLQDDYHAVQAQLKQAQDDLRDLMGRMKYFRDKAIYYLQPNNTPYPPLTPRTFDPYAQDWTNVPHGLDISLSGLLGIRTEHTHQRVLPWHIVVYKEPEYDHGSGLCYNLETGFGNVLSDYNNRAWLYSHYYALFSDMTLSYSNMSSEVLVPLSKLRLGDQT